MIIVGHFPAQPHCFAYGGFDIQMNRVIDLLSSDGVKSIRVNPWNQTREFTVAHFWGGDISHSLTSRFCSENNIPTVFSVLLPSVSPNGSWLMRMRGYARRLLKGHVHFANATALVVLNEQQAWIAEHVLGIDRSKIHVIPTIVDQAFFEKSTSPAATSGPILCVGTICPRKNQLNLLRAAAGLQRDVILCGSYDSSQPRYREAILRQISAFPSRIHHFHDFSPREMAPLYHQASVVACISHHETEPTTLLEAMICNRAIVVSDRPFAHNPKFNGAHFCDPTSIRSIQSAIERALADPTPIFKQFDRVSHRADSAVRAYRHLYASLANNK